MKKKRITLYSMTIMLVLLIRLIYSNVLFTSEETTSKNPLYTGKEIIYYLFWTKEEKLEENVKSLQKDLQLTDDQIKRLKEIGLNEHKVTNTLLKMTKSKQISIEEYNTELVSTSEKRNQTIKDVLGEKYPLFENWIEKWWAEERAYRNNIIKNFNE